MIRAYPGFAALLLTGVFSSSASARPTLDQAHLNQLGAYNVLVFSDPFTGGIDRGKAIGVFDATTEEVFRVATDYAKYQDFMPRVQGSRIVEGDRDHAIVEITAELPWPAGRSAVIARYNHERLPGSIYRVQFQLLRGNMKRYLGSLYIEPFAPGRSAVTYELVAQPDGLAPRSAVNRGVRRSAGSFVNALRQRINDLHRLGYLHAEPAGPTPGPAPLAGSTLTPKVLKADR